MEILYWLVEKTELTNNQEQKGSGETAAWFVFIDRNIL